MFIWKLQKIMKNSPWMSLILTKQYDTLCSQFDLKPDMIIYLRSDPVTAYERMVSRGRLEESSAKFNYIKDLHEAYENWLMDKKSPYDFPILKVIDANLDSEKVYKQIKCIIEQFFICEHETN